MSDLYLKRLRTVPFLVTAEITRPSNTTTYTAGDIIGDGGSPATILTFSNIAAFAGGGGVIDSAMLLTSGVPSLALDASLHLFDTAFTMSADNAAWAPSDPEAKREVIWPIMFSGGNSFASANNRRTPGYPGGVAFKCLAGTRNLLACLVARNAYVPVSDEVLTVSLIGRAYL